jgi:hypothetical protein
VKARLATVSGQYEQIGDVTHLSQVYHLLDGHLLNTAHDEFVDQDSDFQD